MAMLVENPLNSSDLSFPILECFHIIGFVVGIGSAVLVDFQTLGLGLRHQAPEEIRSETALWTIGGLTVSVFAGMLLYSTDPDKYYLNTPFLVKTACLIVALLFHFTIRRSVLRSHPSRGSQRFVAVFSLILWVSVVLGGMVVSFTAV